MISIASISLRQLRLTVVLLVVALAITTTMTIVYATSGGADQNTGQTGVPGTANSQRHSDSPGSSSGCRRPAEVVGPLFC